MKKKLLIYCDNPVLESGFAQVAKQILPYISELFEVTVAAIGEPQREPYDQVKYPYKIISTYNFGNRQDIFGLDHFYYLLTTLEYDVLMTFNDVSTIKAMSVQIERLRKEKNFKWVNYSPIDADVNYFADYYDPFLKADIPVTYTQYGKDMVTKYHPVLKNRMQIVGHGCDTTDFFPIDPGERKELRQRWYNITDEFLILNVNRNQWRKDLGRTIAAFDLFRKEIPNSKLYLHTRAIDTDGINMYALLTNFPKSKFKVMMPEEGKTYVDRETLNRIYNCADVLVSTSVGEGWGLSTTEAFAAKVPVVVPRNTAFTEIVGESEERGWLAESGKEWSIMYSLDHAVRPLADVGSMVDKLKQVKSGAGSEKVEAAYTWAKENTWEKIGKYWQELLKLVS